MEEHVADAKPLDATGKEVDIVSADRSYIQNLSLALLPQTLHEQP
jgi:hypothetical protein